MTQQELTSIVSTYYSEKIQMATLNENDVTFLLFKPKEGGLKEFKGYSVKLMNVSFDTEQDVRAVVDDVITNNVEWYNT